MFSTVNFGLLYAAVLLPAIHASAGQTAADTVFRNGSIYSLDDRSSKHQAMAVKDGRITFLGSDNCVQRYIGSETHVFDLEGRMAMPGLVDAHMHLLEGGANLLKCSLNYQPLGLQEVLDHITSCLDDEPDKSDSDWLQVIALDYYSLVDRTGGVTKADLDKLKTKRPVIITSVDAHTHWVNTAALKASSISADTPNPPGGIVERLPGSQEPSGILQDNAITLLTGPAPPTADDNIASARAALKLLREQGVTTFQDANANADTAAAFEAVKKQGGLSARGYFDYLVESPNSTVQVKSVVRKVVNDTSSWNDPNELDQVPSLKWQAVKIYIDGIILYPANTGALIDPYFLPVGNSSDWQPNPAAHPDPYWTKEILGLTLEELIINNIDAQIHVDGDMAVKITLDALENFRNKHGDAYDYRIGLAHNEVTDPNDWPRFAELKADPIMSFQWSQASSVWIPNTLKSMGPVRSNLLEAFGDIARFGSKIVYGSDWPIDPLDEWLAIKAGVTRSGDPTNPNSPAALGPPYDGPGLPGLTLTREEAIRAITVESARFLRAHDNIGSLEVGKLADVIILKANYFEVPEEEIARQKALLTMVGGEVVYIADDIDFGNGVKAKFPNNSTFDQALERKSIGGLQGRSLSAKGREAVQRLAKRNLCVHGPKHKH